MTENDRGNPRAILGAARGHPDRNSPCPGIRTFPPQTGERAEAGRGGRSFFEAARKNLPRPKANRCSPGSRECGQENPTRKPPAHGCSKGSGRSRRPCPICAARHPSALNQSARGRTPPQRGRTHLPAQTRSSRSPCGCRFHATDRAGRGRSPAARAPSPPESVTPPPLSA